MSTRPDSIDPEITYLFWAENRAVLVDARPTRDLVRDRIDERIPGSVHIDPGRGAEMDAALQALPRERLVIAYCDEPAHAASAQIARRVRELGLGDGSVLSGGFRAWKEAGYPVETFGGEVVQSEEEAPPPF